MINMTSALYFSYFLFFFSLFFTNNINIPEALYKYILIPAAVAPIEFFGYRNFGILRFPIFNLSIKNTLDTFALSKSWIFFYAVAYGAIIIFSSIVNPSISIIWFWFLVKNLFYISIFILVTARLVRSYVNFIVVFFIATSFAASLNALINIYLYFNSIQHISDFILVRLAPSFGCALDQNSNPGAMPYAIFLVGASSLLSLELDSIRKKICIFNIIILFFALCLMQSRGALFGSLISIFFSNFLMGKRKNINFLIFPPLAASFFLLIPTVGIQAIKRLDNSRFEAWQRFLRLGIERPVIGVGERIEVAVEMGTGVFLGHAHNIFLSAFVRGGFFGFIFLASTYLSAINKTYKFLKKFQNPLPLALILLDVIAGSVDFDILVFLPDWQWVTFWLPLGVAVAVEHSLLEVNNYLDSENP